MNTRDFYTWTFIVFLLFALLLSSCEYGTHPVPNAPKGVPPEQADFLDWIAYALGNESWEASQSGVDPILIGMTNEDMPDEFVMAGVVGDKILGQLLTSGAADAIGPGEAYAACVQTSLYSIQQAFSGNPNAKIWMDASGRWIATFLPSGGNAWYMGFIDVKVKGMFQICQQLQNCGSFVNAQSASELAQAMKDNGWKLITASQVPTAIKTYFLYHMGWLKTAWFVRLQGVTASPLFVLGETFSIPQSILLPEGYDWEDAPQQ